MFEEQPMAWPEFANNSELQTIAYIGTRIRVNVQANCDVLKCFGRNGSPRALQV